MPAQANENQNCFQLIVRLSKKTMKVEADIQKQ